MDRAGIQLTHHGTQVDRVRLGRVIAILRPRTGAVEAAAVCDDPEPSGEGVHLWIPVAEVRAASV
jgi:hypothetical protein